MLVQGRRLFAALLAFAALFAFTSRLCIRAESQAPSGSRQLGSSVKPLSSQTTPGLLLPIAIAYDAAGNLFFADARLHQVFELTLAGTWSVIAGTGEQGFAGDGGPAASALLNSPRGLAVAKDGTLYIADTGNQRIRAVVNGVISTIAGTGIRGYSGEGPALQTALREPTGLALDSDGGLLFCDTGNHRVRKLTGGAISTLAGSGVQGFDGDGGLAGKAALDTPVSVATRPDGVILIADSHNQRVRALQTDGTISTLAGSGMKGLAGDGGPASAAQLSLPLGVGTGPDGTVYIADAGNQRIRSVSPQAIITTIAGSGVQGSANEGALGLVAGLNSPRAVGAQHEGQPVLADTRNGVIRELASDSALYTLALLVAPRASTTSLVAAPNAVYGNASATGNVTGSAASPQGTVTLRDGGLTLSSSQPASGNFSFDLSGLTAGVHALTATYAGDGLHGASSSPTERVTIMPASAVATAFGATAVYGAPLPVFTGAVTGILPKDAGNIQAVFSSAVTLPVDVGTYPVTAVLKGQGSENYTLSMDANSGSLVVTQAPSQTTLSSSGQTYAGLSFVLSTSVASSTVGTPTGAVDFLEGSAVISSATLVNGSASATIAAAAEGVHAISARYNGSLDFLSSQSATTNVTVAPMPDFSLTVNSAAQSVQGGSVATFNFSVSPQGGPFTGVVSMSVTGLPPGATASFSPAAVVPGASTAIVALSVQTVARSGALHAGQVVSTAFCLAAMAWLWSRPDKRRMRSLRLLGCLLLVVTFPFLGCGTRTTGAASSTGQSYSLTIRGTGTNLASATVSHTTAATLTIF